MTRSVAAAAGALVCLLATPQTAVAQNPADASPSVPRLTPEAIARALGPLSFADDHLADGSTSTQPVRACDGCPERHLGRALITTVALQSVYNAVNRARDDTARVGPSTWWSNLRHGFEWDTNPFAVNQFGHPYQGSGFFTAGRAWGLSFWESAALTAFGAATWEFFGENNRASLNDVINTTFGGVALGEMFHRTAWLIRDTRATGRHRFAREVAATAIDPLTGFARFLSGDASRVADTPSQLIPDSLGATVSVGVLWQGTTAEELERSAARFAELDLRYGDPRRSRSRTPYESFSVRFRFGGGALLSDARVRGKLYGRPFGRGSRAQLTVAQTYDYVSNRAYAFGGQGVEAGAGFSHTLSPDASIWLAAWGGLTALGAIDSRLPASGDSEVLRSRDYDYGPGSTFGGTLRFTSHGRDLAALSYQGYQIYVVDGLRANHVLQRGLLEWQLPLRDSISLGTSVEFFHRRTSFGDRRVLRDRFSQVRLFMTKTVADVEPRPQPATSPRPTTPAGSRLWLVGGGGYAIARSGCAECPDDGVYRHTGDVVMNAGMRLSPQMDAGAELAWSPSYVEDSEPIRTTFVLGVVQFRPWADRGAFLKGGMGVGLVRNWIAGEGLPSAPVRVETNALALGYGGGWVFRRERRVTLQVHAAHRVAALGDLQTTHASIQNVVGNFWTIGAGLVVR